METGKNQKTGYRAQIIAMAMLILTATITAQEPTTSTTVSGIQPSATAIEQPPTNALQSDNITSTPLQASPTEATSEIEPAPIFDDAPEAEPEPAIQPTPATEPAPATEAITVPVEETTAATSDQTTTTAVQEQATTAPRHSPANPNSADDPTSVGLPNGVYYQVLKPGSGPQALTTQTLYLHYTLYFTNGNKVESSRDADLPIPIHVTAGAGDFIPGAEAGVAGMRIGEIRKIYVPAAQAYGENGNEAVPPNTDLIFEMELVDLR